MGTRRHAVALIGLATAALAAGCGGGHGSRTQHAVAPLYWGIFGAIAVAVGLVVMQLVVLKMPPFDNKSEFQVVTKLSEGSTAETTARLLDELSRVIEQVPEVSDYQIYAGCTKASAPEHGSSHS
jgi:multidrug efflux pump subunit AcrB